MNCICGDNKTYNECCGAIIDGAKKASTPEELMRSRYTAYVNGDVDYLMLSTAEDNRHIDDAELIREFSSSVEWLKLDVLNSNGTQVEFKAYYRDADGIKVLHEKSNFILKDGTWLYTDGDLYNSKVERNESCPCQSGKKFKKCCA